MRDIDIKAELDAIGEGLKLLCEILDNRDPARLPELKEKARLQAIKFNERRLALYDA